MAIMKVGNAEVSSQDGFHLAWDDGLGNLLGIYVDANGNIGIHEDNLSVFNFPFQVKGHAGPSADSLYNLGSDTIRWANIYADNLYGDGANITNVNASTLGGLNSNSFIRSDANDSVSGNTTWLDSYHIILGTGSDMELYHNGTNSYLDNSTGSLLIRNLSTAGNINLAVDNNVGTNQTGILIDGSGAGVAVQLRYGTVTRLLTTSDGVTISGDLVVNGDFTVTGTLSYQNVTNLQVSDNIAIYNFGEVGAGVTAGSAGIRIDRGTSDDYLFVFDEVRDAFVVGVGADETAPTIASLQVVATRADSLTNQYIPQWDNSALQLIDSGYQWSSGGTQATIHGNLVTIEGAEFRGNSSVILSTNGTTQFLIENQNAGASARAELYVRGNGNNFFLRNYGDGTTTPNLTQFISTAGSSYFEFWTSNTKALTIGAGGLLTHDGVSTTASYDSIYVLNGTNVGYKRDITTFISEQDIATQTWAEQNINLQYVTNVGNTTTSPVTISKVSIGEGANQYGVLGQTDYSGTWVRRFGWNNTDNGGTTYAKGEFGIRGSGSAITYMFIAPNGSTQYGLGHTETNVSLFYPNGNIIFPAITSSQGGITFGNQSIAYDDVIWKPDTSNAPSGYQGYHVIQPVTIPGSGTSKHLTHFANNVGAGTTSHDVQIDNLLKLGLGRIESTNDIILRPSGTTINKYRFDVSRFTVASASLRLQDILSSNFLRTDANGDIIAGSWSSVGNNISKETSTLTAVTGGTWYRIINFTGSTGRGWASFTIRSQGGTGTPFLLRGTASSSWSNVNSTISITHITGNHSINGLRIVRNAVDGTAFLDLRFSATENDVIIDIEPLSTYSVEIANFADVTSLPLNDVAQCQVDPNGMGMLYAHSTNIFTEQFYVGQDGSVYGNVGDFESLVVAGTGEFEGNITISNNLPSLSLIDTDNSSQSTIRNNGGNLESRVNDTTKEFTWFGDTWTTQWMKLDSNGLSLGATDPEAEFHMFKNAGEILFHDSRGTSTTWVGGEDMGGIRWKSDDESAVVGGNDLARIWVQAQNPGGGYVNGELVFSTFNYGVDGLGDRMKITRSGDVLIGIASPVSTGLHLGNNKNLVLYKDGSNYTTISQGAADFTITYVGTGGTDFKLDENGNFILAETTGGRVGIGTGTPSSLLDVAGNVTSLGLIVNGTSSFTDKVTLSGNDHLMQIGPASTTGTGGFLYGTDIASSNSGYGTWLTNNIYFDKSNTNFVKPRGNTSARAFTGNNHIGFAWYFIAGGDPDNTTYTSLLSYRQMYLDASSNLNVVGDVYASGGNSTQWNTAYSWGNHTGLYVGVDASAGADTAQFTGEVNDVKKTTAFYAATGVTNTPDGIGHMLSIGVNSNYSSQLFIDATSAINPSFWYRANVNSVWNSWAKVWDSLNFDGTLQAVTNNGATTSNTITISNTNALKLTSANASMYFDDVNAPDGLGFKRIVSNDGAGNFSIRAGNYYSTGEKYAVTGSGATHIRMDHESQSGAIYLRVAGIGTAASAITWDGQVIITTNGFNIDNGSLFVNGTSIITNAGVLENVTGNISMFTNDLNYITNNTGWGDGVEFNTPLTTGNNLLTIGKSAIQRYDTLVDNSPNSSLPGYVISSYRDSNNSALISVNDNAETYIRANKAGVWSNWFKVIYASDLTGAISTVLSTNLTVSRALISNGSGKIAVSSVTSTELGYLSGVTSAIQTQLNGLVPTSRTIDINGTTGNILVDSSVNPAAKDLTANRSWTISLDSDLTGLDNITVAGSINTPIIKDQADATNYIQWNADVLSIGLQNTNLIVLDLGQTYPIALNADTQIDENLHVVGSITAGGSISDRRFKENIERFSTDKVWEVIDNLQGYSYNYTQDDRNKAIAGKASYGLIAQEVAKVLPNAVEEVNGRYLLDYNSMSAIYLEGLKSLYSELKSLKARVSELEYEVERLSMRPRS